MDKLFHNEKGVDFMYQSRLEEVTEKFSSVEDAIKKGWRRDALIHFACASKELVFLEFENTVSRTTLLSLKKAQRHQRATLKKMWRLD